MRFEQIEHTADVGLKAYGRSLGEMFESAALGMFALMADLSKVEGRGEFRVELGAPDKEKLLVDWLTELIYMHEVYGVILNGFEVRIGEGKDDFELKATVRGETVDPDRHSLKKVVKAVTYHMLEINEKDGYLKVLFDV